MNIITATDSYKFTHHKMYPPRTSQVYSYYESRVGSEFPYTVFFGLQTLLKKITGVQVTKEKIDAAEKLAEAHLGPDVFNRKMWDHILFHHDGRLPVRIKAVPEGSVVPTGNVLMTIENTDPECAALTNHLETILCHLWMPCNVATLSRMVKEDMLEFLEETSDRVEEHLPFMLHDFGMRGATSYEHAALGGAAHLVNFQGTDTIPAIELLQRDYSASMPAQSVAASEHSVMTAEGKGGERCVVGRIMKAYPTGLLSIVGDSYDIFEFCEMLIRERKDQILARDGKIVIRPDSGEPVSTVLACLEILERGFGTTKNSKGFKVLPPQLGMIWGDGVGPKAIHSILRALKFEGWAADNIVFGMGGGLLQKHNRDTQRFAFKASAIKVDDRWREIRKVPLDASKASKGGRLKLRHNEDVWDTVPATYPGDDELQTVFENGVVLRKMDLDDIRLRASILDPVSV